MSQKRRPLALLVAALVIAAMLLADLFASFALAEEPAATAVPAISFAAPGDAEVTTLVAQFDQPRRKRRTLMDLLFGRDEPEVRVEPPVKKKAPVKKAALPPTKPAIEKALGATRLAVFGDSMAVDLAKALDRMFAEDPNIAIIGQGVGSSGFARPDFFDWNKTIGEQIAANSFDIAIVMLGINDRQSIRVNGESYKSLSTEWSTEYSTRVAQFVTQLRNANKPTIWIGLPPMSDSALAAAVTQINELQKLAAFSGGAEFLDISERFLSEDGTYSSFGPDLNGNRVRMRRDDGIHFSAAGADKLAFFVSQTLKLYYRGGGGLGVEVADALAGTEAQLMVRPPYQGLGQIRLLEVAGAVISLTHSQKRANDLLTADVLEVAPASFDMDLLVEAPVGRADAFGVGKRPKSGVENPTGR